MFIPCLWLVLQRSCSLQAEEKHTIQWILNQNGQLISHTYSYGKWLPVRAANDSREPARELGEEKVTGSHNSRHNKELLHALHLHIRVQAHIAAGTTKSSSTHYTSTSGYRKQRTPPCTTPPYQGTGNKELLHALHLHIRVQETKNSSMHYTSISGYRNTVLIQAVTLMLRLHENLNEVSQFPTDL